MCNDQSNPGEIQPSKSSFAADFLSCALCQEHNFVLSFIFLQPLHPSSRRRKRTLPLFMLFLPYPREFCSLAPNFPGPSSPLATRPVRAAFANALPSPCSFSFTKLNTASPVVSSLSLCTLVDPTLSQVTNTSRLLYRMVSSLS